MITSTWTNTFPMAAESMAGYAAAEALGALTPAETIDFCRCINECDYEELALVKSGGLTHETDFSSFIAQKVFSSDTIEFKLFKAGNQVAVLNASTYGILYDFGSIGNNPKAKGFRIDWSAVQAGFGYGKYTVKTEVVSLGQTYTQESHIYNVQGYSPELADNTVKIESFQNGYIMNGFNYTGANWYQSIRISGKFGDKTPELIANRYKDTVRREIQIQDEIQYTYKLITHLQVSSIFNSMNNDRLLANQIYITDYNIKNQEVYRRKPVILTGIPVTTNHNISTRSNFVYEFRDRYQDTVKRNISSVLDAANFPSPLSACPVANVRNSNDSYNATVSSGGTLTIPDINITTNLGALKSSPAAQDVNVDVENTANVNVGTQIAGKHIVGDLDVTVNNSAFGSTPAETDFNVPVVNTDLDPVGSKVGSNWEIGDVDVEVNGVTVGSTPAETTFTLTVEDTDNNPVGYLDGTKWRVPAGVTPSGIQFHDPLPDQYTSYRTGDVGDRVQNAYWPTYTKPLNPAAIAELDYANANYWFKLANALTVDGVSNTTRFVDVDGGQTFSATGNKNYAFLDKLTGFLVVRDTTALSALTWNNSIDNALSNSIVIDGVTYSDWYLASVSEANDIFGVFANNGNWVDPITSNTIGVFQFGSHWLSRTDPTATTQANYMQFSSGIPFIFSQAKTTATRPIWIHKAHNLISA